MSTCKLAPDWLHKSEQPIRCQVDKLDEFLTMTQTHKFPLQWSQAEALTSFLKKAYEVTLKLRQNRVGACPKPQEGAQIVEPSDGMKTLSKIISIERNIKEKKGSKIRIVNFLYVK